MLALALSVLYDGRFIASSRPPRLVAQTIMVPLRPYITALAARVSVDPRTGSITIARREQTLSMAVGSLRASASGSRVMLRAAPFYADDTVYVPLAAVASALGERVSYTGALHAVLVGAQAAIPLATMTPFDPAQPQASPTRLFTPEPKRVDRPVLTGTPHPRRTPIAATPSWP